MKKYLLYLAIAILVVVVAFFAYKKIYGSGFHAENQQNALLAQAPVAEQTNVVGGKVVDASFF